MAESLEVDPVCLFMSADQLDMHNSEHDQVHAVANAEIASAESGWVGSSGGALRGKLALLESVSAHVSKELTHHRDAFHDIGRRYQNIDDGSASEIIRARQNL
ncbi:MAG: hypothetical protein QOI25_3002 [Mycobacterium sp.]|jgi:uncharacterized protein YukE|nr:hypothetical protein [Mycobacterium sp.]